MEKMVTKKVAAQIMGYTEQTLDNWRRAHKGPEVFRDSKGRNVYKESDLAKWAKGATGDDLTATSLETGVTVKVSSVVARKDGVTPADASKKPGRSKNFVADPRDPEGLLPDTRLEHPPRSGRYWRRKDDPLRTPDDNYAGPSYDATIPEEYRAPEGWVRPSPVRAQPLVPQPPKKG